MELLGEPPAFDLHDETWRVFSRHEAYAPQYVADGAVVSDASITEGCEIYGEVRHSVLGTGVKVLPGARVLDSVIMSGTVVGEGAEVAYSIVDSGVRIGARAKVGSPDADSSKIAVIGAGVEIPEDGTVAAGDMVSLK